MANRQRLYTVACSTKRRGGSVDMVVHNGVDIHKRVSCDTLERDRHELDEQRIQRIQRDTVSLLYIKTTEQACLALRRATQRIRANIRKDDMLLLSSKSCAILLPETPLLGAQAVAQRMYSLLTDIEYDLQVLYGSSAYSLLQQLQTDHVEVSLKDKMLLEEHLPLKELGNITADKREDELLPYLAFLASYPSKRLLHILPYELADRYHCIPVGAERGVLTLATCQRLQQEIIMHLREVTQRDIFQVRCDAGMINDVLRHWQCAKVV